MGQTGRGSRRPAMPPAARRHEKTEETSSSPDAPRASQQSSNARRARTDIGSGRTRRERGERESRRVAASSASASTANRRPARVAVSPRKNEAKTKSRRPLPEVSARGVAVLILIVVALAGTLPALQNLWMQQREYHALLRQVESVRTENENLRAEINRWSDRDYVASQARARLHYVRPGETQYVVVDPPPGSQEDPLTQPARPDGPLRPWYMIVADTVTSADTEPSTSDPGDAGSTPTSNPTDIAPTESPSTDDTE